MIRGYRFIAGAIAITVALTVVPITSHAQQRDARAIALTPAAGTGAIAGVVTSADSNPRPLRYANVVIIGAVTGTLRVTATDSDGRFTFANLPPDRYVVGASKPPYLGAVAGAKRPARPGTPIALASGQRIADVSIQLPMGAAITGTITDDRSQPAVGATVTVRQWRMQNGERMLTSVPGAMVNLDDRGRYRIYGLAPGEYVVSAVARPSIAWALTAADVDAALKNPGNAAPVTFGSLQAQFASVFFPGVVRASDATAIVVAAGEEHSGADFRIESVRVARVDGIVVNADGQPFGRIVQVIATPAVAGPGASNAAAQIPDGRFTFQGLSAGSYDLAVQAPSGTATPLYGLTRIEVDGSDLSGITITLRPTMILKGQMQFSGGTAPSLAGRRVPFQSLRGQTLSTSPLPQPSDANGAFTITRVVPGRYLIGGSLFFGAMADSVTWALDSVTVDGVNVTDVPVDISAEKPPKEIVVTYTDRWQEVSGHFQTSSGGAASGYTLVLFPSDKTYWLAGSRRILVTRPGTDGGFRFGGPGPTTLPPGDYLLAAVTDIDRDEQFDPAFLSTLVPAGTAITIKPGERKTQDLAIR